MPPLTLILATLTLITLPTPPPHHSGNQTDEQAYLFKKVLDACVPVPGKLARFSYRIADVNVCTQAWCIAIGLYASNSRVRKYETMVRRGVRSLVPRKRKRSPDNRTNDAKAFIRQYILVHAQFSPVTMTAYVDFAGLDALWQAYKASTMGTPLKESYLKRLWPVVLAEDIYDPKTGAKFTACVRRRSARGFSACDTCEMGLMGQMMARSVEAKAEAQRIYRDHLRGVGLDRDESFRIQRHCRTSGGESLGFSIDGMDMAKTQLPVCQSQAKTISKLYRIKQKVTGVDVYGSPGLLLFRTLPDVPTGANLTSTIISRIFSLGLADNATQMYIQWDGSSDNVAYTNIWFFVWLLVSAEREGWPLRHVYLLRFVVGHTHNRLDAMFSQLSKALFGNHSRGASRRDVLSLSEFRTMCEKVFWYMYVLLGLGMHYSYNPNPKPPVNILTYAGVRRYFDSF